ncbi:MAG: hypothetical protein PHR43_05895 [Dehalococcoidales bacterium]|nr:hypothetical protein [Dehalococcoidales bacterium]
MNLKPDFMAFCLNGMPRRSVAEACQVMVRNFPECTCIPLPTLSQKMWTERTPALQVDREKKRLYFDLAGREDELAEFYDRYLAGDLDYFAISPEVDEPLYTLAEMYRQKPWALKYIHFNFPGLFAWGLSLKDRDGNPALYDDTLKDIMIKTLAMKVRWRARKIRELFPGAAILATAGDGALSVFSSAGGTGAWGQICQDYNELLAAVDGISGIHCCDNFDWSLLMQTNARIINFDAYRYGNTMVLFAEHLREYLKRGGMIAWGIVPTTGSGGDITTESPASLASRLQEVMQAVAGKGIDAQLLRETALITPTCETVSMPLELADKVYEVTAEVSRLLREKYFG